MINIRKIIKKLANFLKKTLTTIGVTIYIIALPFFTIFLSVFIYDFFTSHAQQPSQYDIIISSSIIGVIWAISISEIFKIISISRILQNFSFSQQIIIKLILIFILFIILLLLGEKVL